MRSALDDVEYIHYIVLHCKFHSNVPDTDFHRVAWM